MTGIIPNPVRRALGRAEWSSRRYQFVQGGGSRIVHGRGDGTWAPPSHRLVLIDRSRYPAEALVAIRKRTHNFRGEKQR